MRLLLDKAKSPPGTKLYYDTDLRAVVKIQEVAPTVAWNRTLDRNVSPYIGPGRLGWGKRIGEVPGILWEQWGREIGCSIHSLPPEEKKIFLRLKFREYDGLRSSGGGY